MSLLRPLEHYRVLMSRAVIGTCLFFLAWRGLSGLLPHQLQQPALTSFHYDLSMWVYKLSGLSRLIAGQCWSSVLFTWLLFGFGIAAFVWPLQRRFTVPFSLLYFLLAINFNFFLTHNSHYLAGAVWLLLVLWPKGKHRFVLTWEGLRYYACWIYGAAFVWKLIYGAFWQWDAGELSARENLAGYLYQNPETLIAHLYYAFFRHPWLLNTGHKLVCLAEGAFVIGFFTRRLDKALMILMLLIHISTYLFADVFFAELLILELLFIPAAWWRYVWERTVPRSVHYLLKNKPTI